MIAYTWMRFSWLRFSSVADMRYNAAIVNSSPAQPANFLLVWDRLYPQSRQLGMHQEIWNTIRGTGGPNCKCSEIGYTAWNNDQFDFRFDFNRLIGRYQSFGFGLQLFSSPELCFNWWLQHDILWGNRYLENLDELAQLKFQKATANLDRQQIVQLIAYRTLGYHRSLDSSRFTETVRYLSSKLQ